MVSWSQRFCTTPGVKNSLMVMGSNRSVSVMVSVTVLVALGVTVALPVQATPRTVAGVDVLATSFATSFVAPSATPNDPMAQFDEAERRFQEGDFAGAVALLEVLAREHGDPVLQYNLARAYQANEQQEAAIDAYNAYLQAAPDARDREEIVARVQELHRQLSGTTIPTPGPVVVSPDTSHSLGDVPGRPPARTPARRALPWLILGGGGVGVVIGVGLGLQSQQRRDDAIAAPSQVEAADRLDSARRLALGANIAFAVGGVLAGAGLAWGITEVVRSQRRSATSRSAARWRLGPAGIVF